MSKPLPEMKDCEARVDMGRRVVIHICKDGTISYRIRGEKVFNDRALPVFSVDTVEQAKDLQIRFGRLQYTEHPQMPGRLWYRWTDFDGKVGSLATITKKCCDWYAALASAAFHGGGK